MRRAAKQETNSEAYLKRFRLESSILNPREWRGQIDFPVLKGDLRGLQAERLRIAGNEDGPHVGMFYMDDRLAPDGSNWHTSVLKDLNDRLKELEGKFEEYKQAQINNGNLPPTEWPAHLAEPLEQLQARKTVALEEIGALDALIEPLLKEAKAVEEAPLPRKSWARCETDRDGILTKIGGFRVGTLPAEEGKAPDPMLYILDERSDYKGLPVHAFKAIVIGGMSREHNYRLRNETKMALAENRPKRPVKFPAAPIYHSKTNTWEFPGYSENVIKKLKSLLS